MKVKDAVYQACEQLGTRTSTTELWKLACVIAGETLNRNSVYQYRCVYRKENRIKVDCRTYKGQPRRNMLNDDLATLQQVKRIKHLLGLRRVLPESIINLLGEGKDGFHSIDQLRNAVEELIALRQAA